MHWHSYQRSSIEIISLYDGSMPFATWLKNYFKQHKKFGSKDRRLISDLCFCYYRVANAFEKHTIEDKLLIGQWLCHHESKMVQELKPDWSEKENMALSEKLNFLGIKDTSVFPLNNELSKEIEAEQFALSHLIQPDLFLRARRGKIKVVIQKLESNNISFAEENDCIRLPNASKIEGIIELDKEAVVQDKSSQQVLNPLKEVWRREDFTAWDCCAASGGKTILLHDMYPKATLVVSDIRESILHNLHARFKRAEIQQYQSFVADVSSSAFTLSKKFDVIICDAPCSGSGTWGRTPEQLSFFPLDKIDHYQKLQTAITINASQSVKEGGLFLYITCSVFHKENEEVVEIILQKTKMKLLKQQYIKGYSEKADTLFTALFQL